MNTEQRRRLEHQYARIIAKTWQDDAFKKRLAADPVAVLKEYDVEVPPGRQVRVVENTDTVFHLVLKQRPADLSHEDLDKLVAVPGQCIATECDICATE